MEIHLNIPTWLLFLLKVSGCILLVGFVAVAIAAINAVRKFKFFK